MKRFGKVVSLLLVLILLLSACGKTETKDNTMTENTSATDTSTTETATSTSDGANAGLTGDLVYWSMWNQTEPQATVLDEAIKNFMIDNPGVKVTINWNGREIRKTLQPALDNGQVVDIWDEDLERVIKNWGDYALNLDDYITKKYPTTNGKAYQDAVMGNLLDLARGFSKDGSVYAAPYQPFVFAYMYNKAHFKEAGIEAVPKTWDEFLTVCEKLKAAGYTPITTDDAYVDTLIGYHLARYKGSAWVESLVKDKTNALWDDEAVLKTAKDFENLAQKGYFSETVGSNKWPAGQQDIAAGTVSMYLNGTWLVNEIMASTGPDFQWGTFAYPAVPGGVDGVEAANYGSQAFQINKNCKSKDAAFALIAYLTTGKYDGLLASMSNGIPVSGSADWPVQLLEAKDVFNSLTKVYPWAGGIQADTDKLPVIAASFTSLISGKSTAEQFIAEMKK